MDQFELLRYGNLHAWVQEKPQDASVGHVAAIYDCPLATYLSETTDKPFHVGCLTVSTGRDIWWLPSWLCHLLERVDVQETQEITAGTFLRLLEECRPTKEEEFRYH